VARQGGAAAAVNNAKRSSSRSAIWSSVSTRSRAAASTIASGMPSRRRHRRATIALFCSLNVKHGWTAAARARSFRRGR
jgi:hypothetical protein